MNLPLVIDIAIGLIFIYLIFSLLTSEILELITTLLQWRAVHLKESIEGLLAGNETPKLKQARLLANQLYENPVLNTLNQEAKGLGASIPRRLNQTIGRFFRNIFKRENVFGDKNSGPSYIGAESFATSLLDTLGIPIVVQKFTWMRMQAFKERLINKAESELRNSGIIGVDDITLKLDFPTKDDEIKAQGFLQQRYQISDSSQVLPILKQFYNFRQKVDETINAYQNGGFDLVSSVDRFEEVCNQSIEGLKKAFQPPNEQQDNLIKSLQALRDESFGLMPSGYSGEKNDSYVTSEKKLLLRRLQPNLTEAVEIVKGFWQLKRCWSIYKGVRRGAAIDAVKKLKSTIESQPNLSQETKDSLIKRLDDLKTSGSTYGYERIRKAIENYPKLDSRGKPSVKQSLLDKVNAVIDSSYTEIRDFLESPQTADLPESVRKTLLEKLEQERSSAFSSGLLSYEFEKVRIALENQYKKDKTDTVNPTLPVTDEVNPPDPTTPLTDGENSPDPTTSPTGRIDGTQSFNETTPSLLERLDEIIESVDEIVDSSYEKIEDEIKSKSIKLPISAQQELLYIVRDINSSNLDFEYETLRKVIENSRIPFSVKRSFLSEVDAASNSSLKNEYDKFAKAIEKQPNLNLSVKQSLLLLAAALTLRKDNELAKLVDQLLGMGSLPEPVERNLLLLAQQAQIKVDGVKEELNQFRREIENWFDRSMERASGVYRRNNKLVAIIIGSFVAVAVNADTVHMVTRLSEDQFLRATVLGAAKDIATKNSELTPRCLSKIDRAGRGISVPSDPNSPTANNSECPQVMDDLNQAAESLSLPIGWGEFNRKQQWAEAERSGNLMFLRYLLGWLVTGIALSMGASFWYELLGKVINVRNTGQTPPPPRQQPNTPPNSGES